MRGFKTLIQLSLHDLKTYVQLTLKGVKPLIHLFLHALEAFVHGRETLPGQLNLIRQCFFDPDQALLQRQLKRTGPSAAIGFSEPFVEVTFELG